MTAEVWPLCPGVVLTPIHLKIPDSRGVEFILQQDIKINCPMQTQSS